MLHLLDDLVFSNPWREFGRLNEDLGRLFPNSMLISRDRHPVNIYTSEDAVKVVAAIPGWEPNWFELSIEGNKLHLKGETKYETADGGPEPAKVRLSRVVTLPFRAQEDNVTANYSNGMLTVDVLRAPEDKPKKIDITTV